MKPRDSIVLIDDNEQLLNEFVARLSVAVGDDAQIRPWCPVGAQALPDKLGKLVDPGTVLVITDYDLTGRGSTGLFGGSIVSWCQTRALPVVNFTRGHLSEVSHTPDLFELRIPHDPPEDAQYAASLFRGFRQLRVTFANRDDELGALRSPAAALASMVGKPTLEAAFAQYFGGASDASGALLDLLRPRTRDPSGGPTVGRLLAYLVGHVLVNLILRYPGPILGSRVLAAYVAAAPDETFDNLFEASRYAGPFAESDQPQFWRDGVDQVLDSLADGANRIEEGTVAEVSRALIEDALDRALRRHGCERCEGRYGGFWCPFTERAICERDDCSVAATSWIPVGADLARVERDFYDEWAPLLGL